MCQECDKAPAEFPYRWGTATVSLLACKQHAKEIFDALNKIQAEKVQAEKTDPSLTKLLGD